jgi:hypothetical protein
MVTPLSRNLRLTDPLMYFLLMLAIKTGESHPPTTAGRSDSTE